MRRWNSGHGGYATSRKGVQRMTDIYEPLTSGDLILFEGDAKRNEVNWARNHAHNWIDQTGSLEGDEADEFAEFFKDAWLLYLEEHSNLVDKAFRVMLDQFREERKHGRQQKR